MYSSNFTPQVKQARNLSQIFNRKSISHHTTHRQSLHLIQIESAVRLQVVGRFPSGKAST